MNTAKINATAQLLKEILTKHSQTDSDAKDLLEALTPLIDAAANGDINSPMDRSSIPGSYFFNERNLRSYPDLEIAYVDFKIELTGGPSPALQALEKKFGAKK
jgi:hypothetical protein